MLMAKRFREFFVCDNTEYHCEKFFTSSRVENGIQDLQDSCESLRQSWCDRWID